jgi:hypothetical protein
MGNGNRNRMGYSGYIPGHGGFKIANFHCNRHTNYTRCGLDS